MTINNDQLAKLLSCFLDSEEDKKKGIKKESLSNNAVGKYVIVRSRNEGLNAGILVDADETGCILKQARRLWKTKPVSSSSSWYEGVSINGLGDNSKVSVPCLKKYIIEDYSITICTEVAENSIREFKSNES